MKATIENIREIVIDVIGDAWYETDELVEEATFDDLGWDDLDKVEIIMKIEKEFLVSFPSRVEDELYSLGSLIEAINRLVK